MEHQIQKPNKFVDSILFKDETGCDLFVRGDEWFVSGDITDEQAQALLDAHNPPPPQLPTIADKLALVGLSIEELKAALS
jgi:hypothetical protein